MSSRPSTMASVPFEPSNAGASGVPSVARRARLFLTTSSWMFLSRSSLRKARGAVGRQADHVHQQQVLDAVELALAD